MVLELFDCGRFIYFSSVGEIPFGGRFITARPPTAPYPFTSVCICARRDIFYYHSSDNFE
jgi:hypothetical protein